MTILDVRRIAFHGRTGDDRSPESFAFPAAMTSMMEYLGEGMKRAALVSVLRKIQAEERAAQAEMKEYLK